jgi:2,5-diamino-6-(ribosylamino)-4(3H)-pyrimidinone 5'-phosphate reductase
MRRPFVYVNMAMTADGKITSVRREYPRFTSELDRRQMDKLRAEADGLLLGAGTMRADDPSWRVRTPEMREYRRSLGKDDDPARILVTASGRIDPDSRFFEGETRCIVATCDRADAAMLEPHAGRAEILRIGDERVDLPRLLATLGERGIERLLVEGGGELNWQLVQHDLVDELHVTVAPALLGGRDAPTLLEGEGLKMKEQRKLRLEEARREGDELFCRWSVVR